jgi:hypothetical protein
MSRKRNSNNMPSSSSRSSAKLIFEKEQSLQNSGDFGFKNGEYFPNENEMDIKIDDEITVSDEEDEEEDENNNDESPSEESLEESSEESSDESHLRNRRNQRVVLLMIE